MRCSQVTRAPSDGFIIMWPLRAASQREGAAVALLFLSKEHSICLPQIPVSALVLLRNM